jgi:hypothetical protein
MVLAYQLQLPSMAVSHPIQCVNAPEVVAVIGMDHMTVMIVETVGIVETVETVETDTEAVMMTLLVGAKTVMISEGMTSVGMTTAGTTIAVAVMTNTDEAAVTVDLEKATVTIKSGTLDLSQGLTGRQTTNWTQ